MCHCNNGDFCQKHKRRVTFHHIALCKQSPKYDLVLSNAASKEGALSLKFMDKLKSFAISFFLIVASGFFVADRSVRKQRILVCRECVYSGFGQSRFCSFCGCFLPAKTLFASSFCPKYKWPAIQLGEPSSKSAVYSILNPYTRKSCGCSKPKPSLPIIGQDS